MTMHHSLRRRCPPGLDVLCVIAGVPGQVAARGIGPDEQAPTDISQGVIAVYRAASQEGRIAQAF
jgi:hypothetical protein